MTDKKQKYSPRIIVFACNSCSLTEGNIKAMNQNPGMSHVRVLRTMCTGRVHPAYVLRAFEKGVDGVLITGCPEGKCDYVVGNEQADAAFRIVRNLTRIIGIEEQRIGLQWIAPEDINSFSRIIQEFSEQVAPLGAIPSADPEDAPVESSLNIDQIVSKFNTLLCYDCGKCTAVCPATRVHEDFSPRRIMRADKEQMNGGWNLENCVACSLCDYRCPQQVSISRTIAALRSDRRSEEPARRPHGAVFEALASMMTREKMPVDHRDWIPKDAKVADKSDTLLYVGCAPYHDAFFPNLNVRNLDAVRGALKILNHLGIEPVILRDERCCGHDYYWSGDTDIFRKLARMNRERIERSGAKRIVFTCPECRYAIQDLYQQIGEPVRKEMKTITEIVAENSDRLDLSPFGKSVTFQDPCRLARNLGDVMSPREALAALPDMEIREMVHSGAGALCCSGKWSHCDAGTKQMQSVRLTEAKHTGAEVLVTSCPKCEIHLKCALQGEAEMQFEVRDLTSIIADALPDQNRRASTTKELNEIEDTSRA